MASLNEIRQLVLAGSADDWKRIDVVGPTYLNSFGMVGKGDNWYLDHKEHIYRAVFKADVNLGLAWGMDVNREDDKHLLIPWRDNFLGELHRHYVDLLWAGMLIDREIQYVVDEGRIVLPSDRPAIVGNNPLEAEEFASTATHWATRLARLIHDLGGYPGNFDHGMAHAGIIELPD